MYHLQKLDCKHGAFAPEWVAKTTTGYAVIDHPLRDFNKSINIKNKKNLYLSPEARSTASKYQAPEGKYNIFKSDVFSNGLVVLEAGILKRLKDYMDPRNKGANILEEALVDFERRYPQNNLVSSTLRNMLQLDEGLRPDYKELITKLPEYDLVMNYFDQNDDVAPVAPPEVSVIK